MSEVTLDLWICIVALDTEQMLMRTEGSKCVILMIN